jgi:pimeloyl-ACP methyl ester carboxylesterase
MSDAMWPEPQQAPTHLGTIEYRDVGTGPAVVFLHLVLADESHWDRMPPLLADRFRCIFPTLPMGAHRLPADAGADLSVDGLAQAVADLITHLELDDVTLVGNDSGGAISQVVATNHPELLARVVLTNCDMYDAFPPKTFAYFNLFKYLPAESFKMVGWSFKLKALWKLPFVFGWLTNEVDETKVLRWADALLASKEVRRDLHAVFKGFGPDVTNAAAAALRTTELPILVGWGADDKAFKASLAERFVSEVPTAELVMIEDCKTLVCWDQPGRLAELITEFYDRTSARMG